MKDIKTLRKEVDKTLQEKVSSLIKTFNDEREHQLLNLFSLHEKLHDLNVKKQVAEGQQKTAAGKFIPDAKTLNETGSKILWWGRDINDTQKKIDALFKNLTAIPESITAIYPFIKSLLG